MEEITSPDQFEKSLKRVPVETLAIGCLASILVLLFLDPVSAVLVAGGAILAAVGFISLKSFVNRYLGGKRTVLVKRALVLFSLRLLLICLIFLAIIFIFRGKVIAFVAGFSSMVVAILIEAIRNLVNIKQWKA
ncbi:MAG: hypothetical protein GYA53_05495 [Acidobacteria bacterium]|jgi:hypothetical protein|nr:hypothetical protein [Acidobacteriota bacterium]